MILEERLEQCSYREMLVLYDNAEELHRTGILPMDAPLRKISEEIFGSSLTFTMTMVSYGIYRKLAIPIAAQLKKILNGAGA